MNLHNLIITNHAREQFLARWIGVYGLAPKNPDVILRKLLQQARPDKMNIMAYLKRVKSHAEPTEYYGTGKEWRFVVCEGQDGKRTVVTVERICREQNKIQGGVGV